MSWIMKNLLKICLGWSLLLSPPSSGWCGVQAWFVHSANKVLQDATPTETRKSWSLAAARGEVEACQLVLRSDRDLERVSIQVTPFRQRRTGASLHPELYRVHYIPDVLGKVPYPDPLVPLDRLSLESGKSQPVWISVRVPQTAPAGIYQSTIRLSAGGQVWTGNLQLKVWNFSLPETPSGVTAFGIDSAAIARQHQVDPDSAQAKTLYARYYEMLLDHKVSAYALPVDIHSEAAIPYLKDPRMTSFMIPYPPEDEALKNLVKRLVQLDAFSKGYFYPLDEPVKEDQYKRLMEISERLRRCAPGFRLVSPFFRNPDWGESQTAYDLMTGRLNIWCPNSHFFDTEPKTRPTLEDRKALGEEVWWYVCCGPGKPYNNFFVDLSAMNHRLLFWQQKRENVEGLLYWNTTWWNPDSLSDPWASMMTVKEINPDLRGDGSLFYPGKQVGIDGPVSSIRLEMIRDGLEDFDLLTLVEKKKGEDLVREYTARLARSLTDFEEDPAVLERTRREMAEWINPISSH